VSIYMGQWNCPPGTAPTFNIPPGVYNITIYNATTVGTTIWLAMGTSGTTPPPNVGTPPTTWLQLHTIPTSWNGYQGAAGGNMWSINTAATTVPINYVLSVQQR
jgi:hypothetical protein